MQDDLQSGLKGQIKSGPLSWVIPGVFDSLSARLAEQAAFPAALVSSFGAAGTLLARSDRGLLSMSERARHLRYIREATEFPLIVDGESGFGNALSTYYMAREFERSGAAAIVLNDQKVPSVSSFFLEKKVISKEEMAGKIRAVSDARDNPETAVIAKTDSLPIMGIGETVERLHVYREAGADLVIIGGAVANPQIRTLSENSGDIPLGIEIMAGENDGQYTPQQLFKLGFRMIFYPAVTLLAAFQAERKALESLRFCEGVGPTARQANSENIAAACQISGGERGQTAGVDFRSFNRLFDRRITLGKKVPE